MTVTPLSEYPPHAADLAKAADKAYRVSTISKGGCEVLIERHPDGFIIVAFRGTQKNFGDIISDIRSLPWWVPELGDWHGTLCHAGFAKAVRGGWFQKGIWKALRYTLSGMPRLPVWVTGHSKGGAEATIATPLLVKAGIDVAGLVTFGSPRAGALKGKMEGVPVWRLVYGEDAVTKVPMGLIFDHVGQVVTAGPGHEGAMGGFLDHKMENYLEMTGYAWGH